MIVAMLARSSGPCAASRSASLTSAPARLELGDGTGVDLPDVREAGQLVADRRRGSPRAPAVSTMMPLAPESVRIQRDLLGGGRLVDRHGDRTGGPDREVGQGPLVAGLAHDGRPGRRGRCPRRSGPWPAVRRRRSNSAAVTSIQRLPSLRENATRVGSEAALRPGRSARLPSVVGRHEWGCDVFLHYVSFDDGICASVTSCASVPHSLPVGRRAAGVPVSKAPSHRDVTCGTLVRCATSGSTSSTRPSSGRRPRSCARRLDDADVGGPGLAARDPTVIRDRGAQGRALGRHRSGRRRDGGLARAVPRRGGRPPLRARAPRAARARATWPPGIPCGGSGPCTELEGPPRSVVASSWSLGVVAFRAWPTAPNPASTSTPSRVRSSTSSPTSRAIRSGPPRSRTSAILTEEGDGWADQVAVHPRRGGDQGHLHPRLRVGRRAQRHRGRLLEPGRGDRAQGDERLLHAWPPRARTPRR